MYNKLIEIIMYLTPLEYTIIRDIVSVNTTVTSPEIRKNVATIVTYLDT